MIWVLLALYFMVGAFLAGKLQLDVKGSILMLFLWPLVIAYAYYLDKKGGL